MGGTLSGQFTKGGTLSGHGRGYGGHPKSAHTYRGNATPQSLVGSVAEGRAFNALVGQ